MKRLFACTLLLIATAPSLAADANGYTAKYECRAGGQYCNVDVATLGNRSCDQTIAASTPWSSINWSNNTICLEAGDHTGKGTLTIPSSANGSEGNYKVLRYIGDNNDDPWKQTSGNQVKIARLVVSGSYWIFNRLTFPSIDSALGERVRIDSVNNIITSRILIEGAQSGYTNGADAWVVENSSNVTLQNSVVRNHWGLVGAEAMGINPVSGTDIHVVNNEVYDWSAHAIQLGYNGGPTIPGYVIENNDVYVTSAMYLGDGRARAKNTLSVKANGSSSNISKIIHNRIWGARKNSLAVCCLDIDAGAAMYLSMNGPFSYILIQNNLFMDSQRGLAFYNGTANHISIIGNIFSGMAQYYASDSSHAIEQAGGLEYSEIYLNSFINNAQYGASFDSGNLDVLCNVLATGGDREGGTPNSSTQADHNVFYDTTLWSFNGTDTKIDKSVSTRTNSNAYSVGAILRTGAASSCVNATDTACFLYKVTTAGTSAGSAPSYCTTLGCTTNDGTMTVQAMRGPYTFYRKLRTSPEPYTIPYARAHASAPETGACPSGYASRSGVGINDVN